MGFLGSIKKAFSSRDSEDRVSLSLKVQATPNDPQARQKLGAFMLRAGEMVEGTDQLARAAILYEKDGFAGRAIAVLRQILKHDPKNNDFLKWLIRLLAAEGLFADAQTELRKIATETSRFSSDELRIDFLHQMAESMPGTPLPYLYISDIYRKQKQKHEALQELKKVVLTTTVAAIHAEVAERVRALLGQGVKDFEFVEPCGFLLVSVGVRGEGISLLNRVILHEEESGQKDRVVAMTEILKSIKEGWNPLDIGAFSFEEVISKRAKAAAEASASDPAPQAMASSAPSRTFETMEEESGEDEEIVRDALERLQAKVHEEVGEADLDTRYNLGIAYKEMGLLNEAAREFLLAMKKNDLLVGASSMLADTLMEQGDADGAFAVLDEAAGDAAVTETQRRDLQYHKAVLLSQRGLDQEAGSLFAALAEQFPGYRDVDTRTKQYRP